MVAERGIPTEAETTHTDSEQTRWVLLLWAETKAAGFSKARESS